MSDAARSCNTRAERRPFCAPATGVQLVVHFTLWPSPPKRPLAAPSNLPLCSHLLAPQQAAGGKGAWHSRRNPLSAHFRQPTPSSPRPAGPVTLAAAPGTKRVGRSTCHFRVQFGPARAVPAHKLCHIAPIRLTACRRKRPRPHGPESNSWLHHYRLSHARARRHFAAGPNLRPSAGGSSAILGQVSLRPVCTQA